MHRLPYPQFPPLLYNGDRCGYPSCRQAIEMRAFPAVTYNAVTPYGTLSRFTELRDDQSVDWDRRSESSRPSRRWSLARRESSPRQESPASVQTSSVQTTATGYSRRREYQTGVQLPLSFIFILLCASLFLRYKKIIYWFIYFFFLY